MEQCLIDNKICSERNRKCKECKLNDCRSTIKMIEEEQKYEYLYKLKELKKRLPNSCKNCSFLEIVNVEKEQVYCPYMIKKCILSSYTQQCE